MIARKEVPRTIDNNEPDGIKLYIQERGVLFMCHAACMEFGKRELTPDIIKGKRVVEVGSYDVNGSLRRIAAPLLPAEYIGVDIEKGPGVDVVCRVEDIVARFGAESFDVVISTEMIEHVRDWRGALSNLKQLCKKGGFLLVTTRSYGFPYHAFPHDFWRFEPEDMRAIFSDFEVLGIESDTEQPGVFVMLRKPADYKAADMSKVNLYCMVSGKRAADVSESDFGSLHYRLLSFRSRFKWVDRKLNKLSRLFGAGKGA